jgi:AcrR family transcriptional regulator
MTKTDSIKELDGRKQRTNNSRQKIVEAMLQLIREGTVSPSAEQVAAKAEVGLRTVFRRFSEMELLFRELAGEIQRIIKPETAKPILGDTWQEKVFNLLERRVSIYQVILPYRVAANFHMYTSKFLRQDLMYWNQFETSILASILPINEQDNFTTFHALNGCMCYDYWQALTSANGLTSEQAEETMKITITHLIKDI